MCQVRVLTAARPPETKAAHCSRQFAEQHLRGGVRLWLTSAVRFSVSSAGLLDGGCAAGWQLPLLLLPRRLKAVPSNRVGARASTLTPARSYAAMAQCCWLPAAVLLVAGQATCKLALLDLSPQQVSVLFCCSC